MKNTQTVKWKIPKDAPWKNSWLSFENTYKDYIWISESKQIKRVYYINKFVTSSLSSLTPSELIS